MYKHDKHNSDHMIEGLYSSTEIGDQEIEDTANTEQNYIHIYI